MAREGELTCHNLYDVACAWAANHAKHENVDPNSVVYPNDRYARLFPASLLLVACCCLLLSDSLYPPFTVRTYPTLISITLYIYIPPQNGELETLLKAVGSL